MNSPASGKDVEGGGEGAPRGGRVRTLALLPCCPFLLGDVGPEVGALSRVMSFKSFRLFCGEKRKRPIHLLNMRQVRDKRAVADRNSRWMDGQR